VKGEKVEVRKPTVKPIADEGGGWGVGGSKGNSWDRKKASGG